MNKVYQEYQKILKENPTKYYQDYQKLYKLLEDSPAYYQGEVIPFLYQPLFFSREEITEFKELTTIMSNILNKVINKYLNDSQFRSFFDFSKKLEELILINPGYDINFPMARFDIFYYGEGNFKFCELNTDGSSGMVKTNTLEKYLLKAKSVQELNGNYDLKYLELVENWIDILLEKYEKFSSQDNKPNIGIMDFNNYGMVSEFKYFKNLIEERGYKVKIIDPRDLEYRNNKLYADNFKVDLIYRRAVTLDLMEHYDQIQDFLTAYRNHDVCVVGSFRSQIIHNKVIFSILHQENKVSFLSSKEKEFIKRYIPKTKVINPKNKQLINWIIEHQEALVLKPMDLYGAEGVMIGKDVTKEKWRNKIDSVNRQNYLVQEFCSVPEKKMAVLEKEKLRFEKFKYTLGLFLYDQKFQGIYTRAGKGNVIASATGCVTLPNFIINNK